MSNWDRYRTFLAVARGGTLAAAAQELGISVSSVHRHVQALEEGLSVRLFERRGRSRVLTGTGEEALAQAERIEEAILHLERGIAGRDEVARGRVVLTTTDTIAEGLLGRYLPTLRQQLPEVYLDVLVANRQFRLGRGEADIALRPGRKPDEPDVVVKHVTDLALCYYASNEYLARRGRPRRKQDLRDHDFVTVDDSLRHIVYGQRVAEQADATRHVFRSPSLLLQARAVCSGLGIGVLPCFLMDSRPGVVRLFRPEREGPLWLAYHADLRGAARVRAVVQHLVVALQGDARVLAGGRETSPQSARPRT